MYLLVNDFVVEKVPKKKKERKKERKEKDKEGKLKNFVIRRNA